MAKIQFESVTLAYPIFSSKSMQLRNQLVRVGTGGLIGKKANEIVTITALNNVSFCLEDGASIGLVGHNGAGKTTLLRAMAGIYPATSGKVTLDGSVSTVIELGAGMDVELSGYENIFRMALLLGSTLAEMDKRIPEIESFTELGDFLSMPVRTYSAGMMMRLMFAVATSIRPEILLVDEMFSTGDASFQIRAEKRMAELIESAKIFVFASHSPELIKRFCKKTFVLDHGQLSLREHE
jgi:ABC-type polysaccharide/polyol phosphate transport system ATPase subunit